MSCGIKVDVDELLKNVKDDHVVRGEIVNGNTLRLHRKEGAMVDVVLPSSEDHDTKISSFDLANRGGKNVLEITQTDGSKFTAYLPETTPPAADKYVTAFDISTQGNTTNLTITRSDNEQFTVQLPQAQGGGGADIYVNKVEVDYRIENETEIHPFLVITRNDGQKFEVELPSGGAGGPDVHLKTLTTDAPPKESVLFSDGDGYYFSKNVPIEATLTDNTKVKTMQPWNRLYWTDYQPFAPFDTENAREVRPVVEIAIVKGRLKLVRDDATATYLDFPNAGGGGGAGGSDKYTRSLNAEMDVDDTRVVGDVEYRRPTLYANLSDGTNISTKLPFEVAFSKRTGDQLFPGASGAGDGAIKDVKPSTAKNRTIVVTDSSGGTKEITFPDNWFNGKDGKNGVGIDSISGQFVPQAVFKKFHEANIIAEQISAPLQVGAYICNELPLPNNLQPNEAKFVVAPNLPRLVSDFVLDKPQGAHNFEGTVYNHPLVMRPIKGVATTWKKLIPGYGKFVPVDAWSYLEKLYYGEDARTPGFLSGASRNTWHPGYAYRTIPLAKPAPVLADMFLPVPMRFNVFMYHLPGATFAMDVFELVDTADEGGLAVTNNLFYRGTMYTQTFPHGDGYFPAFIDVDGMDSADYLKLASRVSNPIIHRIREVSDSNEKQLAAANLVDVFAEYGIGKPNHG